HLDLVVEHGRREVLDGVRPHHEVAAVDGAEQAELPEVLDPGQVEVRVVAAVVDDALGVRVGEPDARARREAERRVVRHGPILVSATMGAMSTLAPQRVERPRHEESVERDRPWIVIVWNDPINLMTYVTYVFQKLFGFPKEKAERLMMQVHVEGKAVVSGGTREKAEHDVARLQE